MQVGELADAALLGALAAALGTPAGVSGGLLLLPALLTVFGLSGTVASATNLVFNIVSTPGGVVRQARSGRIDRPLARLLTGARRILVVTGLISGLLGGFYGLGGAVLAAPAALVLTGWPVHRVSGAALITTLVVSVSGLLTYTVMDLVGLTSVRTPHWPLGLALGVGGLIGGYAATRYATRLPDRLLRGGLAMLVAGAALRLAWI